MSSSALIYDISPESPVITSSHGPVSPKPTFLSHCSPPPHSPWPRPTSDLDRGSIPISNPLRTYPFYFLISLFLSSLKLFTLWEKHLYFNIFIICSFCLLPFQWPGQESFPSVLHTITISTYYFPLTVKGMYFVPWFLFLSFVIQV